MTGRWRQIPLSLITAIFLAGGFVAPVVAQPPEPKWQGPPPGAWNPRRNPENWQQLPPETRQRMTEDWQRFQQLPPEDRQRIQQRARQFRQAPPDERFEMCAKFRQEHGYLPPRCLPR